MEERTRTININPIKVRYTSGNKIPFGLIPKRVATTKEALHILRDILGLNIDLSLEDCGDIEDKKVLNDQFTSAVNTFFINGDYGALCNACYCTDDMDNVNFVPVLQMIAWCQNKGIL